MKQKIVTTSLLSHPVPDAQFSLVVDASGTAVGAVLQQQQQLQHLAYFSRHLKPAEQRYSTSGCELLAMYLAVKHFLHSLESRQFVIYTDHRPLTFALRSKPKKYSPRETRHLDFVSQFTNDIRHISGERNAAALSCLPINSLFSPSDIDLQQMALDQPRLDTLDLSSPEFATCKFAYLPVSVADTQIICDTSTNAPRFFVPMTHRRVVFDTLDHLAHPRPKATVKLISARFFGPNMRRDITAWTRSCVSCQRSKVHKHLWTSWNIQHPRRSVQPCPYRYCWTIADQSGIYQPPDLYRPFHTVAWSYSPKGHFSWIRCASPYIRLDNALQGSNNYWYRPWQTVWIPPIPGTFQDFRDQTYSNDELSLYF